MKEIVNGTKSASNVMITFGYIFALLGGLIGILIGARLSKGTALVEGQKEYIYDEESRRQGKIILSIAIIMTVIGLFLRLAYV